jgi:hypothetical protein
MRVLPSYLLLVLYIMLLQRALSSCLPKGLRNCRADPVCDRRCPGTYVSRAQLRRSGVVTTVSDTAFRTSV